MISADVNNFINDKDVKHSVEWNFINYTLLQVTSHHYCITMYRRQISTFPCISGIFIFFVLFSIKSTISSSSNISGPSEKYLFDFTKTDVVDNWQEQSDTVRSVGMSKAVFVIHKNSEFRRAIFFALLNPQPNGAGFAGIRSLGFYDLTGFTKLQLFCRSQGHFNGFKVVLRHKGLNDEPNFSFEQYFQAPKDEFAIRTLPFSEFKAYYRGKRVNNNETLDISQVTSIGIQMYGGVYQTIKQKGPATLEIDWIRAE